MKRLVVYIIIFLGFTLSSCFDIPEFEGVSNFKMGEIKDNTLNFSVDVDVFNPNGYGIRVRPSVFDVYVGETHIGKGKLKKSFKMKRKKSTSCHVPVEIELDRGMLFKLMGLMQAKNLDIRLAGVLKASVMGIPRREKIDEKRKINLKDLDLNLNLGNMGSN